MGGAFGPKGTSGRPANEHLHGHIAMTYTSIATLLILGDDLSRINRRAIAKSLAALQDKQGNFVATYAGSESDLRLCILPALFRLCWDLTAPFLT